MTNLFSSEKEARKENTLTIVEATPLLMESLLNVMVVAALIIYGEDVLREKLLAVRVLEKDQVEIRHCCHWEFKAVKMDTPGMSTRPTRRLP